MADTARADEQGHRIRRAPGVDLVGEYQGSGYTEPPSLARLGDGQVVRLTPLLTAIAAAADGERSVGDIARDVQERTGRELTPDDVDRLVQEQLRPAGIVADEDGDVAAPDRFDPLRTLTVRGDVVPARWTRRLSRPFAPLLRWPVMALTALLFVAAEIWAIGLVGFGSAVDQAVRSPSLFLLVLVLTLASASFHEIGHAAAMLRAGRDPGAMGAGLLLVWPALYTDVTSAYLLPQRDRLKVDLAGIYFNMLFALAVTGLAMITARMALSVVVVVQLFLVVQQLLPFVRFDGYYIVSDAIGVPDLYLRLPDLLRSMVPGREDSAEVKALTPWARRTARAWVVATILLGIAVLGFVVISLRGIVVSSAMRAVDRFGAAASAATDGRVTDGVGALAQAGIALLLPAGFAVLAWRLGRRLLGAARAPVRRRYRQLKRRRHLAELDDGERERLQAAAKDRDQPQVRRRAQAVLASVIGWSADRVATHLSTEPDDVRALHCMFRRNGASVLDVSDELLRAESVADDAPSAADAADLGDARARFQELVGQRTAEAVREAAGELDIDAASSPTKTDLAARVVAEEGGPATVDPDYAELWSLTYDALYDRARHAGITGRSAMTKSELVDALAPGPEQVASD